MSSSPESKKKIVIQASALEPESKSKPTSNPNPEKLEERVEKVEKSEKRGEEAEELEEKREKLEERREEPEEKIEELEEPEERVEKQEEEKQEEDETSSEEEYIFEKSLVPVWQMRQIKEYYEQNNRIAIPTKYNTKECIEFIKKYVYGK